MVAERALNATAQAGGNIMRFKVAIEHARLFEERHMEHAFFAMRKHLAWYCRGFDGAKEIRTRLMQANSSADVETILLQ